MARFTYMVQRATTKAWLDRELPLATDGPEWALSAAGTLTGTLPEGWSEAHALADQRPLLEEWGSIIHVDANGVHRGAFIVHRLAVNARGQLQVEAIGFSSYLHGMPFDGGGAAGYSRIGIDPADVLRDLWAHAQSQPDGDLGVQVVGSTPVRLGTPKTDEDRTSGPYELPWWETPDCGREADTLAAEAPFDWAEETEWDGEDARLRIRVGHPRLGRRREGLAFVEGENIVAVVTPERDGASFANSVVGLGSGEGQGALRHTASTRDGRLRRVAVLPAKDVTNQARLETLVRGELDRRQPTALRVDEITVRDHPNAPIGSWVEGDDIRVQAFVPHFGAIDLWCRVVAWRLAGEHNAILTLERSDTFNYGS